MSDFIWRGNPRVEARFEQDYRNLRQPLLNVRDIARLAGIAHGGVQHHTYHKGKVLYSDLSMYTGRRNDNHKHIEATTSAARRSIIGDRLYSGTLRAATYGPTLFALAIYADKAGEPPVLYNGMSSNKSLTLRVTPEKKFDAALIADVEHYIATTTKDAHSTARVSASHDANAFTLSYNGYTAAAMAAHHHGLFNEIFGNTVALDSSINMFGAPLHEIQEISQEALEQATPFESAEHVQRVLGQPQRLPNTSILDFWSRQ